MTLFYSVHKLIGHETFQLHLDLMKISVSCRCWTCNVTLKSWFNRCGWVKADAKLWSHSVHIGVLISQKKRNITLHNYTILRYFTRSYGNVTNQWWLFVCVCLHLLIGIGMRARHHSSHVCQHFSFRLSAHIKDQQYRIPTLKCICARPTTKNYKQSERIHIDIGQANKQHAQNSLGIQKSITLQ